ncbi:MAG TPA: right-handed parallel beta-helix repeat-containing protein [Gemmatimonadales bacterium]|nr:right-handed parallel beta-helix repeat-containing protein [Gemmatimonadales bacterium]
MLAAVASGLACPEGTAPAVPLGGASHFVSPTGSPGGLGTVESPWDLVTGLGGGGGRVRPGDTVWVAGGTYQGVFRSTLQGVAGAPVVVRAFPGERVIIDAGTGPTQGGRGDAFVVAGDWTEWWDLEFMSSDPDRSTNTRPNMVVNDASHTKYIHLVVHDGGIGFYNYGSRWDVEVTGCVFFNNGWERVIHGSGGHALYVRSNTGPVLLRNNVMFNQFDYGVHIYTDGGADRLKNIRLVGNVSFNNGSVALHTNAANILVGGGEPADAVTLVGNRAYFSPGVDRANVQLGYRTLMNGTVEADSNTVVGGSPVLDVGFWSGARVRANAFAGPDVLVRLRNPVPRNHTWGSNRYHRDPAVAAWGFIGQDLPLASWRELTGLGTSDAAAAAPPLRPEVFVTADPYETGRATVTVYNWGRHAIVPLDLSGVLLPGRYYEVRNVQDLFGEPATRGLYDGGPVEVPMTGVTPPAPIGLAGSRAPVTGPEFNVFLIRQPGSAPAGAGYQVNR